MNRLTRLVVVFVGVALLLSITLPFSCAVVPPGHRGLSVTLGKLSGDVYGEGLAWKKPWIEIIVTRSIQQTRDEGVSECFSSDLQTVTIQFACLYRQPEPKLVELYRLYGTSPYLLFVEPRIQERLKEITAKYPAEQVVKARELIRASLLAKVRETVSDLLQIDDIVIRNIDLTNELERSIEAKMVQQQQAQAKVYELEKEMKQAEIVVVRAKAEAEQIRITGEALAKSPKMVELEIVKKWNGTPPQTVVVSGMTPGAQIVLPVGTGK